MRRRKSGSPGHVIQVSRPLGRVVFLDRLEEDRSFTHRAHFTIVVAGDVACGASFLTMPQVGHRLPMRNRGRNHAILLRNPTF